MSNIPLFIWETSQASPMDLKMENEHIYDGIVTMKSKADAG